MQAWLCTCEEPPTLMPRMIVMQAWLCTCEEPPTLMPKVGFAIVLKSHPHWCQRLEALFWPPYREHSRSWQWHVFQRLVCINPCKQMRGYICMCMCVCIKFKVHYYTCAPPSAWRVLLSKPYILEMICDSVTEANWLPASSWHFARLWCASSWHFAKLWCAASWHSALW